MIRIKNLALRYKLFLGLAIVGGILLVAVYFLSTHFVLENVKAFLVSENAGLVGELREQLVGFYVRRDGWEGVEEIFDAWTNPGWRRGGNGARGGVTGRFQWGNHVLLTDPAGTILYASSEDLARERLTVSMLSKGLPILVEGEQVGLLFTGAMLNRFSGLEEELLASVRRSVAITAFISLFVATAVGLLLLRLITAPFGRLIRATQSISSGDLTQPISVETRDEIGELSQVLDDLRVSLARSEEVRRHMLADIAHELRNPLAILRAKVEAMLDKVQPTSEENLGSLNERLQHLSHLVDELQDIALAEAGELPLDLDTLDLAELLHDVEGDARALLQRDKKEFLLEVPAQLPSVCADRRRLLQIMWNLLSNALHHTAAGDTITVRVEPHSDDVLIHVIDTGEGMDKETLAHLFDRFYRGDRERVSEGLGLGLAITQELIRAHGGKIWVESHSGKGTRFSFTLPSKCR
jgi:signal transduction histidine kinase